VARADEEIVVDPRVAEVVHRGRENHRKPLELRQPRAARPPLLVLLLLLLLLLPAAAVVAVLSAAAAAGEVLLHAPHDGR
jgi:hypothetical protein